MNKVLVAGLPPDVPGLLARRLAGAVVEEQATPREAADALGRETWTLAVVDAAWLEPALVDALAPAEGGRARPAVLLAGAPGDGDGAAMAERIRPARTFPHPLDREALARAAAERLTADGAGGAAGAAGLHAAVAGVWARYRDQVLGRVDVLEAAALSLLEGGMDRERRREAEREAHKLAGSVGTFGFAEASRLSREAETLLGGASELTQADALRLADLAVAIRAALAGPAAPAGMSAAPTSPDPAASPAAVSADAAPSAAEGAGPVLLIVDADRDTADRLAMEASARGMRPAVARGVDEARAALAQEWPDAALLDVAVPGGMELLGELAGRADAVPSVVLTRDDGFAARVDAARRGGRGFLRKPLAPGRVLDAVEPLLRAPGGECTALAVDEDPAVLEAIRFVLEPHGIGVTTLAEPERFWAVLESAAPEVVVLDVDMPGIDGLELCRVLRADARWQGVPVVFLSARTDAGTMQAAFAAGGDDFVVKPFVGPALGARIQNRLERVRVQRGMAETDPLTGLPNRRGSEPVLDRFLRLAASRGDPLAFAAVEVDGLGDVSHRPGHAAGDEVLARVARLLQKRLRPEDVVARWGGQRFAVGMYGVDRPDGVQRLADALEVMRGEAFTAPDGEPFAVTFSAGVAEFGADGRELASLHRAAAAALDAARAAGGARVLPAGWEPGQGEGPRTVDVLVVEDDPAIARLLQHALQTRGLRHVWVNNGEEAARLLTGPAPELRARVILLDVDLPGLDGLGVLRLLARERLVERTRVIMLTVRTHEAEVVRALEMGAFDHVSKPFSVPVLLQRIRRALRV